MPESFSLDYTATLTTASDIVKQARARLLAIPRNEIRAEKKEDNSFVTRADKDTELFIRDQLQQHFPLHSILGEEFPSVDKDSPYQWVIDPIDGTHSFKHHIPLYGIMLALLKDGRPVVSVVDLPGIDRHYAASKGHGATCNGFPIQIKELLPEETIDDEVISLGERSYAIKGGRVDIYDKLFQSHNHVRVYCDCFGHMLAADSSIGAMVDFNIRSWDSMASILIVDEAGGKSVCVGKRFDGEHLRFDWVIGKPSVVDWICQSLNLTIIDYM